MPGSLREWCQQCTDRNLECKPIIPPKSTRFDVSPKHAQVDLIILDSEDARMEIVVSSFRRMLGQVQLVWGLTSTKLHDDHCVF